MRSVTLSENSIRRIEPIPPLPPRDVPLLPVHQCHCLEAGAVLDLSRYRLGALDTALGHVKGNVHDGRDGPGHQADGELPQKLEGGVLK